MTAAPVRYVRKDDNAEVVFISCQARTPNGPLRYEIIEPKHHAGETIVVSADKFFNDFKLEREPPPSDPVKPISTGSRDEWRAWALHMEKKYREAQRNYERLCTHDRW